MSRSPLHGHRGEVVVRGLTWRPSGRRAPVLDGLDLRIEPGERVLLAGPSGSGKSTLLRAVAGLLLTADAGDLSGEVRIDGAAPQGRPGQVGLLLQDPSAAVVADRVGRDVAFGLENTCVPAAEMPDRVRAALTAAHFPYDERRRTGSLSGGEAQRLALAGALALDPSVLLLDEPTSMLDPVAAAAVRRSVLEVVAERGTTLVVVEHRIEPWLAEVDRCLVLDHDGAIVADGAPAAVLAEHGAALAARGVWVPGLPDPAPLQVGSELVTPAQPPPAAEALVAARDVGVRYTRVFSRLPSAEPVPPALAGVDCDLAAGHTVVLAGTSGAGKSTLLSVLAGLRRPDTGAARVHPAYEGLRGAELWRLTSRELAHVLSWVPQVPAHGLVRATVLEEMLVTSTALGRHGPELTERARALLGLLGLGHLEAASVHHLSGGEQRRLVVAAAVVHGPAGLLLDEPTVGQDRTTWAAVTGVCGAAAREGVAVAVATHDAVAQRALLHRGRGSVVRLHRGRVEMAA